MTTLPQPNTPPTATECEARFNEAVKNSPQVKMAEAFANDLIDAHLKSIASEIDAVDEPRSPIVYQHRPLRGLSLSEKEQFICKVWLETQSIQKVVSEMERVFKKAPDPRTIKAWMDREHVAAYLAVRLKEWGVANGWTREKWITYGTEGMLGERSGEFWWKQLGVALGYMEAGTGIKTENLQINIVQKDGER